MSHKASAKPIIGITDLYTDDVIANVNTVIVGELNRSLLSQNGISKEQDNLTKNFCSGFMNSR